MTIQDLEEFLQKKARENVKTHSHEMEKGCTTLDGDWFIQKNEKYAFHVHPSYFNYKDGRQNWQHRHDFLEMLYVYKGACRQVINDRLIDLRENDVCILDTNVTHSINVSSRDDILINCLFRKSFFDMTFLCQLAENDILSNFFTQALYQAKSTNNYIIFHCNTQKSVREILCRAMCEYYDKKMCSDTIIGAYMIIMFSELLRTYRGQINEKSYKTLGQINVSEILLYLKDHYNSATLESTAHHFGFHPNYLSSIFKKLTGKRFIDYLHQIRLQEACNLLKSTNISIDQIASMVGYSNISFFYRLFKNKYGITPAKYRCDNISSN